MRTVQELDLRGLHILDGGLATQLEALGCDLDNPLWSASVIERSPETIARVHREYLEAGADCLLTASYQISAEGFKEVGRSAEDAAAALHAAVRIAEDVRDSYQLHVPRKIWIAASLGPYGAVLHNGAEYHGRYSVSREELIGFHARRLEVLAGTGADFVAFETIPSLEEAEAILAALGRFPGLPASITFTCRNEREVAHGERLSDCAAVLDAASQIVAMGVNCTEPRLILSLIGELAPMTGKPIIVCPNSGEVWDANRRVWAGAGERARFASLAAAWRNAGAKWIGGCCRTGPAEVRAIAEARSLPREIADYRG